MIRPEAQLAAVALGSNLDDPAAQLRRAFDELRGLKDTRVVACSPLYRSAAVGLDGEPVAQPDFCNAAALLETRLAARTLLHALQSVEAAHGRRREQRGAARSLDLDLLVYGNLIVEEPGMTIPHPRMAGRNFVLFPLRDIAPRLPVPGLGLVGELAEGLDGRGLQRWPG
jgi:2-amino-4-hydroxy-6-hydroxymethyldihydropteridine diphosphokinase